MLHQINIIPVNAPSTSHISKLNPQVCIQSAAAFFYTQNQEYKAFTNFTHKHQKLHKPSSIIASPTLSCSLSGYKHSNQTSSKLVVSIIYDIHGVEKHDDLKNCIRPLNQSPFVQRLDVSIKFVLSGHLKYQIEILKASIKKMPFLADLSIHFGKNRFTEELFTNSIALPREIMSKMKSLVIRNVDFNMIWTKNGLDFVKSHASWGETHKDTQDRLTPLKYLPACKRLNLDFGHYNYEIKIDLRDLKLKLDSFLKVEELRLDFSHANITSDYMLLLGEAISLAESLEKLELNFKETNNLMISRVAIAAFFSKLKNTKCIKKLDIKIVDNMEIKVDDLHLMIGNQASLEDFSLNMSIKNFSVSSFEEIILNICSKPNLSTVKLAYSNLQGYEQEIMQILFKNKAHLKTVKSFSIDLNSWRVTKEVPGEIYSVKVKIENKYEAIFEKIFKFHPHFISKIGILFIGHDEMKNFFNSKAYSNLILLKLFNEVECDYALKMYCNIRLNSAIYLLEKNNDMKVLKLDLVGCQFGPSELEEFLKRLMTCQNLETISIDFNKSSSMNDFNLRFIFACLYEMNSLKNVALNVRQCKISQENLDNMKKICVYWSEKKNVKVNFEC